MSKIISARYLGLVLAVATAGCLGGCGIRPVLQGKVQPPGVTLEALTVYPPATTGWFFACRLRLKNPNPEPLRVLEYDYEVWLEGQRVVQGESRDAVTLPARGEQSVMVPVLLKLPVLPQALRSILKQRRLHYEIAGSFRLASLAGGLKVPFRFQGRLTEEEGLKHLQRFLQRRRKQ